MRTWEDVKAEALTLGAVCSSGGDSVSMWRGCEQGGCVYLGGFPAQTRHVRTVRPLLQDLCPGSRESNEAVDVPGAMLVVAAVAGCNGVDVARWLDRSFIDTEAAAVGRGWQTGNVRQYLEDCLGR